MSLLIDRLRADKHWKNLKVASEDEEQVKYWLLHEAVPVYDITNVARYLATGGHQFARAEWADAANFQSFPNVAPPHRLYWMEMASPCKVFSLREGGDQPDRLGLCIWESQPHDDERWYVTCSAFGLWRSSVHPLVSWRMEFVREGYPELLDTHVYRDIHEFWGDRPHTTPQPLPDFSGLSREEAELMLAEAQIRLKATEEELVVLNAKLDACYARWVGVTLLFSALMAHSLLTCKNVEVETNQPEPGLSRAWERRHGEPLVRFTTLRVNSMHHRDPSEGTGEEAQRALHIVRGHFKTFSPERPLFGRLAGTYWWDSQVRGDAKYGLVVKEYEVVA
jgi:hypothetical protein